MSNELRDGLAALFQQTAEAHHAAYRAADGFDPDWPIWYADHLLAPLADQLSVTFVRSQLIYCLMNVDFEHQARAKERPWPEFYADAFIERFAASANPKQDTLALYHFEGCPFCSFVRSAIDRLGLDVELRDINSNAVYRSDLIKARGRATVPVLRINSPGGGERWLPESRDIVRYLERMYDTAT